MKIKAIVGLAILGLAVLVGWRVGACEWANFEFQDDLHDLASQAGSTVGLVAPKTESELRSIVLDKARAREIELQPEQITVRVTPMRSRSGDHSIIFLSADYTVPIQVPGHPFSMHFTPSSEK